MAKSSKIVSIDFDNTLVTETSHGLEAIPGSRQALEKIKSMGFEIVIHSCRIGIAEGNGTLDDEILFMENTLAEFLIPYDRIDLGSKPVAEYYIDDRAIAFDGDWNKALGVIEKDTK